jgi:hypothetical protein
LKKKTPYLPHLSWQYTIAGDISILFIEVKPKEQKATEYLDYVGQVIAEIIVPMDKLSEHV